MASLEETVDQDYLEGTDGHIQEADVEKEAIQKYVSTFGFDVKTNKTDLVIIVEGERLYVSSVLIELLSTVFAKLIENLERDENGMLEIELPDVKCKDFVDFLACFYPGKHHQLSDESVFRILPVASKYHLKLVEEKCVLYLLNVINCSDTTNEMLSQCMSLGYEMNIQSVKERSFEIVLRKQKQDPHGVFEALPTNKSARCDLYDAIIPALVSNKNKLDFSLMVNHPFKNENKIDLTCFQDARNWSNTFLCTWSPSVEILTGSCTFNLWGVRLGVKNPQVQHKPPPRQLFSKNSGRIQDQEISFPRITFGLTGDKIDKHLRENYSSNVAIIYTIHNRKGRAFNSYITRQFKGLHAVDANSETEWTSLSSDVDDGFVVDGEFTFSVHVLLDKPGEVERTN